MSLEKLRKNGAFTLLSQHNPTSYLKPIKAIGY